MIPGMNMNRHRIPAVLAVLVTFISCAGNGSDGQPNPYEDPVFLASLPWPTAAWTVEPPGDHGMDPGILSGAGEYAGEPQRYTQGVVIVRHNVIVAEWYFGDADMDSVAISWSIAKSFSSALVGIAIGEGSISGVESPMTEFFPEWAGTDKADMTLGHVLSMTSGLDWDEGYEDDPTGSDVIRILIYEPDAVAYVAGLELAHEPGSHWAYSSGDSMLLSGVLEQATGMRAAEYAEQVLFSPIGMEPVEWDSDPSGHTLTYCCLETSSRQFAKFGLLYLRQGKWDDTQVVPAEWVDESTQPSQEHYAGYGYQWWLYTPDDPDFAGCSKLPADLFMALGHHTQFIFVIPSLDLVIVRNGVPMVSPDDWNDCDFLAPILESIISE